jgi:hypothetical protein
METWEWSDRLDSIMQDGLWARRDERKNKSSDGGQKIHPN